MKIAVLGAGSWGTAVAIHLAKHHQEVVLWSRDKTQVDTMRATHENGHYLPGISFPSSLKVEHDLNKACAGNHLLIAVPSHAFKDLLAQLPKENSGIAWLTKGLEPQSACFLHQ